MSGRLESEAALKSQLDAVLADPAASSAAQSWYARLASFISEVRGGVPARMGDADFLRRLWEENPVANTGSGTVRMDPALQDSDFRAWFAQEASRPLPGNEPEAEQHLTRLYDELAERLKTLCGRTPRLKMNRVLCALFPSQFTSLADVGALRFLHKEMGGSTSDHPVRAHKAVRAKIDALLGAATPGDETDAARRICIPWLLYERFANEGRVVPDAPDPATTGLKPLPATLRRKGLTAIKGSFQTLLAFMEDLREGVTREEFASLIKAANPDLAASSIGTVINVVSREFDLCRREGDAYRLSARGLNLLDTQDPDELADHLLTKILGVDHVVRSLASGPCSKADLLALLKRVHPGWTSDYAPASLLYWLSALDVTRTANGGVTELTERGRRWASMVRWEPESLPRPELPEEAAQDLDARSVSVPPFQEVASRLEETTSARRLRFDPSLVGQLHSALWFHPVRHFAVLCGISGSGKTQLALQYALALTGTREEEETDRVRVIPVQPGWYDPTPLLGYVSPIQEDSYRSAPFLELLLRAAADPSRPYVAVLDEMNLSHPEQYLATLLSAMETHGWLDLHDMAEEGKGVPNRVRYPANLAILGTLNMDETTHGLSDKVLDRAYTLEFWDIDVDAFPGWKTSELPADLKDRARDVMNRLADALSPVRLHFGWRTIDDILGYLSFHQTTGAEAGDALDAVVYAKVLPKLRGDTSAGFQTALEKAHGVLRDSGLHRCATKVKAMQDDLQATGSARFWR